MMHRYIDVCEELAESTVLSHDGGFTFHVEGGVEHVEANFPPEEAIGGTAVLFRQLAESGEEASYSKVRKAIGRRIHETEDEHRDEHRDEREECQVRWNRAHGQLRAGLLTAMADRKAMRLRSVSDDVPVTDEDVQPQQLLSLFQYGDLIHWGKQAAALRALAVDDFSYTKGMHDYISVASQLSHFYLGYSLLVARAAGRRSPGSARPNRKRHSMRNMLPVGACIPTLRSSQRISG